MQTETIHAHGFITPNRTIVCLEDMIGSTAQYNVKLGQIVYWEESNDGSGGYDTSFYVLKKALSVSFKVRMARVCL